MLLPAFVGYSSFFVLPGFQALERDTKPVSKYLSVHTGLASPSLDAASLSVFKKPIELVLEVRCRDTEETSKPFPHSLVEVSGDAFFDGLVHIMAHADLCGHLPLHQSPAMAQPAEPVRDGPDLLISMILPVKACGLQDLPRSAQGKAMDI